MNLPIQIYAIIDDYLPLWPTVVLYRRPYARSSGLITIDCFYVCNIFSGIGRLARPKREGRQLSILATFNYGSVLFEFKIEDGSRACFTGSVVYPINDNEDVVDVYERGKNDHYFQDVFRANYTFS